MSEFCNVAAASPVNGTSASGSQTAPTIASGSFTPGANNGGNLIWTYAFDNVASGTGHYTSGFTAGGGATLLHADIGWTNYGNSSASEYYVQITPAAINPGFTAAMATADTYNVLSVALKAANAGTAPPPGIRIVHLVHATSYDGGTGATWNLQAPSSGNALVLAASNPNSAFNVTSITDSKGNSWVYRTLFGDEPNVWVASNAKTDPTLIVARRSPGFAGEAPKV